MKKKRSYRGPAMNREESGRGAEVCVDADGRGIAEAAVFGSRGGAEVVEAFDFAAALNFPDGVDIERGLFTDAPLIGGPIAARRGRKRRKRTKQLRHRENRGKECFFGQKTLSFPHSP